MKIRSEKTAYIRIFSIAVLVLGIGFWFSLSHNSEAQSDSGAKPEDTSVSFAEQGGFSTSSLAGSMSLPQENGSHVAEKEFVSNEIRPEREFNGIGLSWIETLPSGTSADVYVQLSKNGSAEAWTVATPNEDYKKLDSAETFSDLVFSESSATSFRVKVVLKTTDSSATPVISNITSHTLDSRSGPSVAANSLSSAAVSTPTVISRSGWGANESLMTWAPQYATPKKFIIHHTAGAKGGSNPASVVRGIYQYHAVTLGWGDIGYNFVLDENGNIFEGRKGGNGVIGAHALRGSGPSAVSYNVGSIGISIMGNYENDSFTTATRNALVNFLGYKSIQNNIDPSGSSYFVDRTMPNVVGHRDVDSTACPGTNIWTQLTSIRTQTKTQVDSTPSTSPSSYAAQIVSVPSQVIMEDNNVQYVTVRIKNTGTVAWSNSGPNFIALNVTNPAGRSSGFYHSSWMETFRPTKMKESTVAPGSTATFEFTIKDSKGEGIYNEDFQLVSEHVTWIAGSAFSLPIKVVPRWKAEIGSLPGTITLNYGEKRTVDIWMKNTGTRTWKKNATDFTALNATDPAGRTSAFKDSSWNEFPFRPTRLDTEEVPPGGWGLFQFTIQAPQTSGHYVENFQAVVEHVTWINGSKFALTIDVAPPYRGEVTSVSVNRVVETGATQKVTALIKNTGTKSWKNVGDEFVALNVNNPPGKDSPLKDPSTWTEFYFRPTRLDSTEVAPGELGTFEFNIKAPSTKGTYSESFQAVAEHVSWIAGTNFTVTIESTNLYEAQIMEKSPETVIMEDGTVREVWVKMKNVGTRTWLGGKDSFNTYPAGRDSIFQDLSWTPYYFVANVLNKNIAPGQTAEFRFKLRAPVGGKGNYTESFEGTIAGGTPIINSRVNYYATILPRYDAEVTSQSSTNLSLNRSERYEFTVNYRNTGTRTWTNTGANFAALNATDPAGRTSAFKDSTWPAAYRPTLLDSPASVAPGQTGRFTFWLQAPNTTGSWSEKFKLVAENIAWMPSSTVTIPISIQDLRPEAVMKIGIVALSQIQVTGNGSFKAVRGSDGFVLGNFTSGQTATVTVEGGNSYYRVVGPGVNATTSDFVKFIPNGSTILQLANYDHAPDWDTSGTIHDNKFRGNIIAHRASNTGRFWAINELNMESYLRGIAEQSNSTHATHLRTMSIIERTYAQYHYNRGGKSTHTGEHFHLDATSGDQVYRGYEFETRSPNVVAAVEATRGKMVTYNGDVVVTPYFSRSDGRTRSWTEVWAGNQSDYPHILTKPDPWSEPSDACVGHCVGLSAYGALAQAGEGKSYDYILKYYYTGIAVTDFY